MTIRHDHADCDGGCGAVTPIASPRFEAWARVQRLYMPFSVFREMRVAERADKASKHDSPEELLEMLECGIRDGWSDKVLRHVVLAMRRHAGDERVTRRLHQLIASGCGAHLRRAIAVALGYAPTASGREMLRALRGDPDKAVAEHAEMSLERLRRMARSPLR